MPELPEVETVRSGLERHVVGRTIARVDSLHSRAIRRHPAGPDDLAGRLAGQRIEAARRRGKYMWLTFAGTDECLILHLGMSGQLLVLDPATPFSPHVRARFVFTDGGPELRFDDQRTFGGLHLDELVPSGAAGDPDDLVPASIAHIGRDLLDDRFDVEGWVRATRRRNTTIKRALLDQNAMSGVGNIYADEALWRAKLHGDRPVSTIAPARLRALIAELREVFTDALKAGGTSFDALYVNVNGESGYFDRSLNAYGRENEPCRRCGRPIRRISWMNRSSYFCPNCQRLPRGPRAVA